MLKVKKALVLLSGGQDSATCLAIAEKEYDQVWTISFDYGQRHRRELTASRLLSMLVGSQEHFQIDIKAINQVAISNLTNSHGNLTDKHPLNHELPSSFVPGRNYIFLGFAAIKAYSLGITDIFTGVCQTDYSGYPDCRDNFIKATRDALALAMEHPFSIKTPLMLITKAETIRLMQKMGMLHLYKFTHTCYEGSFPPCGKCPACKLRQTGFDLANVIDPLTIGKEDPIIKMLKGKTVFKEGGIKLDD